MGNLGGMFWWDVILFTEALLVVMGFIGFRLARAGRGQNHHLLMLVASVVVMVWISIYMIMALLVGFVRFGGPQWAWYYVFIPLILVHSLISTVALFLAFFSVLTGYQGSRKQRLQQEPEGPMAKKAGTVGGEPTERVLLDSEQGIRHRKIGMMTLWFFLASAVSAYLAYAMLFIIYKPPA